MPAPTSGEQRPGGEGKRTLRRAEASLRTSATGAGVLGGVSCFVVLSQFGVPPLLAGILGLGFALLVRVAVYSLGRDWLLTAAHQRETPPQATPETPPAPGQRPRHQ